MHRSEYPDHPLVHRLDQSWVERIDVRSPESWSYDSWNTARYPMNDPRYLFLKWTISPFLRALWSRRVGGTEHLPKHGPCIVIANHASYLDFLILGSLFQSLRRRQLYFWANSKVMKHPVWRFLAHPAECIEVQSTGHHRNLWTRSRAYLERNRCLCIFPEGTRSRSGQLAEFRLGYLKLANALQIPILPIVLRHTHAILPPHATVPRLRQAKIDIHPPITFSQYQDPMGLKRLNEHIREDIFQRALATHA